MKLKDISARSDKEIITALRSGDNDAWEYIFEYYVVPATKFPSNRWRMAEFSISVEDILGVLWEKLSIVAPSKNEDMLSMFEKENGNISLKKWMYKQVSNVIGKMVQKMQGKKQNFDRQDLEFPLEEQPDKKSVMQYIENKETRELFESCFNNLWEISPQKAYVFLFFTQAEFSHEEIAKILKIDKQNARQIYHRAKELICTMMKLKMN